MSNCLGDGKCIKKCYCELCSNINNLNKKYHGYVYSRYNCCVLVECRCYDFCKKKLPQYILNYNELCYDCEQQLGNHNQTNIIDICCVCLYEKNMLKLSCNHIICNNCWYKITENSIEKKCPLCRYDNSSL